MWRTNYLSQVTLADEAVRCVCINFGDAGEAIRIFEMFDRFQPAEDVTIPPGDA
jgi:hypothetical protein